MKIENARLRRGSGVAAFTFPLRSKAKFKNDDDRILARSQS